MSNLLNNLVNNVSAAGNYFKTRIYRDREGPDFIRRRRRRINSHRNSNNNNNGDASTNITGRIRQRTDFEEETDRPKKRAKLTNGLDLKTRVLNFFWSQPKGSKFHFFGIADSLSLNKQEKKELGEILPDLRSSGLLNSKLETQEIDGQFVSETMYWHTRDNIQLASPVSAKLTNQNISAKINQNQSLPIAPNKNFRKCVNCANIIVKTELRSKKNSGRVFCLSCFKNQGELEIDEFECFENNKKIEIIDRKEFLTSSFEKRKKKKAKKNNIPSFNINIYPSRPQTSDVKQKGKGNSKSSAVFAQPPPSQQQDIIINGTEEKSQHDFSPISISRVPGDLLEKNIRNSHDDEVIYNIPPNFSSSSSSSSSSSFSPQDIDSSIDCETSPHPPSFRRRKKRAEDYESRKEKILKEQLHRRKLELEKLERRKKLYKLGFFLVAFIFLAFLYVFYYKNSSRHGSGNGIGLPYRELNPESEDFFSEVGKAIGTSEIPEYTQLLKVISKEFEGVADQLTTLQQDSILNQGIELQKQNYPIDKILEHVKESIDKLIKG